MACVHGRVSSECAECEIVLLSSVVGEYKKRVFDALEVAFQYAGNDGEHHKDWVIDQMVRALTAGGYENFVAKAKMGDDGPETYSWNVGIAP